MLEQFLNNVNEKALFERNQKVLLAVSGGIDSMVLLHLFEKSGFEYGIAHCNFKLRGEESDADEAFVKEQVLVHGVPAFFESFETEEYAKLCGISIEMAARELRYAFFEKVRIENGFDFIATAHHKDDLIETFFLNLSRKTGIKGLTGIKEKSGVLIRPLLFTDRIEIEKFAASNYIDFREDSSNSEVVYQRNFLRHKILPQFQELNPSFKKNLLASIGNLKDTETAYFGFLEKEMEKAVKRRGNNLEISIHALLDSTYPKTLLFEILSEFHFNAAVIDEVYNSLEMESGKRFYSRTHWLLKDRELLFLSEIKKEEEKIYYIEKDDIELFDPYDITIEKIQGEKFSIIRDKNVACLDLDKVEFPLLIRKWKKGDYFQPLGMSGFKKVSDFFIDEKIPVHKKENTWLLCSGKNIVWIMGYRLDNRFKIHEDTQKVLKIEIKPG